MRIVGILLASLVLSVALNAQQTLDNLSWQDTQGKVQRLGDFKGKIVVLNFWATWCEGCRHEMPLLAKMQEKYADKGLVVLGGSVDDSTTQPKIRPFGEENKIPFPLLVGATTEQMQKLELGEAIPATVFIDTDGKVVARVLGELDKSDFQHRIEWMLGKHSGKEPAPFVNGLTKKKPEPQPSPFSH
jgi:thiol-disulfide isomerase/thioredoxin